MEKRITIEKQKKEYLSQEEISKILILAKENTNHYLILGLFYSCGLTIHELIHIKVGDINMNTLSLTVPGGKKLRKRILYIPEKLRTALYSTSYGKTPESFLFQGNKKSFPIHRRTIQKLFEKIKKISGIRINVTSIRKSVAVHLYQLGWSKLSICKFLGHSQFQSTRKMLRGIPKNYPLGHPIQNMHTNIV